MPSALIEVDYIEQVELRRQANYWRDNMFSYFLSILRTEPDAWLPHAERHSL